MDYLKKYYKNDLKIDSQYLKRDAKKHFIFEKKQENLKNKLPNKFEKNYTYHVLCQDEWNNFSYIPFIQNNYKLSIKTLFISTWIMGTDHLRNLFNMIDEGEIREVYILMNDMFKTRNRQAYALLMQKVQESNGKVELVFFKNHAKITMLEIENDFIVIESSANFNNNPRLENYTISNSEELYNFHRNWMINCFKFI